jgi:hypothetical protein
MRYNDRLPVTEYAAMPNAIPTTQWLVVPIRSDGSPVREGKGWKVVSSYLTIEAAERDAAARTKMLEYVSY